MNVLDQAVEDGRLDKWEKTESGEYRLFFTPEGVDWADEQDDFPFPPAHLMCPVTEGHVHSMFNDIAAN